MESKESLEAFYKRKFDWIPENLKEDLGHFNVFRHQPHELINAKQVPYKRRDFYKIMFVKGPVEMCYADQVIKVQHQALFFSNPHIPYKCSNIDAIEEGVYCIFNHHFMHKFGDMSKYDVFQPKGNHVFELGGHQASAVKAIFEKMFIEIESDYRHKYDVLRNMVFELLHFAMKIEPQTVYEKQRLNASQRISTLFLELLERQFPIDENHLFIQLRSASNFAQQLNVHVNHLNRAVKESTGKTTTQIIAERVCEEAKIMLKQSTWQITEIAYSLGFLEVTHFNNFFKKHLNMSPSQFRNTHT